MSQESMTLREAAARTARSVTTLRRYVRSGRLRADKRDGRFGPEYFVSVDDLAAAGCPPVGLSASLTPAANASPPAPATGPHDRRRSLPAAHDSGAVQLREGVPVTLYHELQLKHEQLLVQYGMIRACGLRALELQAELEGQTRQIDDLRTDLERQRAQARAAAGLRIELARARRELEARDLEVAALEEKVRGLEMLTRNAVTSESIERQFSALREQARRVDELSQRDPEPGPWPRATAPPEQDH